MAINFKLDIFEGPLDLLLHLIKKAEVDIYDIPISEITEQYISYIKEMGNLDLEVTSEFLVMASTLLEIKSRMLLPRIKSEDETAADEDPRKELVEKLIEYRKYKEFAGKLKEIEGSNLIYFKTPEIIDDLEDNTEVFFKNITLENLMMAFKKVVTSYENRFNQRAEIPKDIDYDEFRIEDKMKFIENMIIDKGSVYFSEVFNGMGSKMELVVTFLALLELVKVRRIRVVQYENFGDIIIEGQEEIWKIS